ncbi:MAG: hypothetical protein ABIR28_01960, partial [Vicinamibacteria bacterium]
MKHIAPLITIVSGVMTGWLVPGDRPLQAAAGVTPVSRAESMKAAATTALPDVAAPATNVIANYDRQTIAADAFAREIIRLSVDADRLDNVWAIYKTECGVKVSREHDFGREWFSLWDHSAQPSVQSARCADVPVSILDASDAIREDLLRARLAARETGVGEATEVGVLRWHTLQPPL